MIDDGLSDGVYAPRLKAAQLCLIDEILSLMKNYWLIIRFIDY